MQLSEFIPLRPHSKERILMATVAVSCGEPREISNELEPLDFNELFTGGYEGVFMVRVIGDSMEAEISQGDILIINRNLQAKIGDKIIAAVNGSYTIKTFEPHRNGLRLVASNEKYAPREITDKDNCEVFGVVTHVIRSLKKI